MEDERKRKMWLGVRGCLCTLLQMRKIERKGEGAGDDSQPGGLLSGRITSALRAPERGTEGRHSFLQPCQFQELWEIAFLVILYLYRVSKQGLIHAYVQACLSKLVIYLYIYVTIYIQMYHFLYIYILVKLRTNVCLCLCLCVCVCVCVCVCACSSLDICKYIQ